MSYNRMFSETAAFEAHANDAQFNSMMVHSSVSEQDAVNRLNTYSEVMDHFEDLKEGARSFSGYSEIPILSNQYFNATMASYVRSFAGFLTIERSMDEPTSLLWYHDLLGVSDNRIVLPNIGKENLDGINARFQVQNTMIEGQKEYSVSTNRRIIPGSVILKLVKADGSHKPYEIKDDRSGSLLAPAGVLAPTGNEINVNYAEGRITFTLGDQFTPAINDIFQISAYEDVAGSPSFGQTFDKGNNRFKIDVKNKVVTADPDMLIGENNLMAVAAAQKSLGMNPQEITGQKLTELYTKLINQKLTKAIIDNCEGDVVSIKMSEYIARFTDYNSRLDAFMSDLVNVDTAFAKRTLKATKATAYLVGENLGNYFRKLKNTGNWTDNTESTYINDLLGYFNGIPVLRHTDVESNTGYAVHKTPGGEMAPLMRGIYLPLTNTPLIGNYNNPTQFAQGIYYQEANEIIFPELIQRFVVED